MEEALKQAVSQVPSLVVLVIVVVVMVRGFLSHIENQRTAGVAERGELVKAIQTATIEHIQARTEMAVVIKDNSISNIAIAKAVEQMAQSVKACPLKEKRE